jgi:hypothetical protein
VVGTYHELGNFVSGVVALPRIVTLHDISLKPEQHARGTAGPGGRLVMDLTAKTYRYSRMGSNEGPCRSLIFLTRRDACSLGAGCSRGMSDLEAYIAEVKARPGGRIEPLPEIRTYETFAYEAGDARSPFVPDIAGAGRADGVRPDADRRGSTWRVSRSTRCEWWAR